jgi:hypothetical protein
MLGEKGEHWRHTDGRSDYQVYLGNNRGVFDMGHSWLKRSDPRFWGWKALL